MKGGGKGSGRYTRPVSSKNKVRFGELRESKRIIWQSQPVDKGESIVRSADRRWTITQGQDHFTLLEYGSAIFRCKSQDEAVTEAARRAGLL